MGFQWIFCITVLFAMIALSEATLCYECFNQSSSAACMRNGRLTKCYQKSCLTEVRFRDSWPNGMLITKRCKQKLACENNFRQNPGVCKGSQSGSTCYCCCHSNRCHRKVDGCWNDDKATFPTEPDKLVSLSRKRKRKGSKCKGIKEFFPDGEWVCSNGAFLGSTCSFYDNNPLGIAIMKLECAKDDNDVLTWLPVKREGPDDIVEGKTCGLVFEPSRGQRVTCSNGSNLGSKCEYECPKGYVINPTMSSVLECVQQPDSNELFWDNSPPTCVENICPELPAIGVEFDVWCSAGHNFGSECYFLCLPGFEVTPVESFRIVCDVPDDGKMARWSGPIPSCQPLSCPEFKVASAKIKCTNGALTDSTCNVTCLNTNHVIHPHNFTSSTCLPDQTWSEGIPCCIRVCPPNAPMDMVIALDSSSSIKEENWEKVIKFVKVLISYFAVGPNATNFAIFRYTTEVDRINEILLNEFDDQDELLAALDKIPYSGIGTRTGVALRHAYNVSLSPSNGNRAHYRDLVLVITDGQTNANDDAVTHAKRLMEFGAIVFVIGVEPEKLGSRFTKAELISLTGDEKYGKRRVFLSHNGFKELKEIHRAVVEQVCSDLCNVSQTLDK
ncbi:uncharacterized protein LOC143469029 [Clavelina lepadiformis]|uniref:uncharacterized protein LOC143469029 n=1 Tax=Clavelina lepadiformis TaxID=159417 RepID=UPI0040428EB0